MDTTTGGTIDTALQSIQTDAADIFSLVVPVILSVLGLTIGAKLLKRLANKI